MIYIYDMIYDIWYIYKAFDIGWHMLIYVDICLMCLYMFIYVDICLIAWYVLIYVDIYIYIYVYMFV